MGKEGLTYFELKRLLYAIAEHKPDGFDRGKANQLILECAANALEKLDDEDLKTIRAVQQHVVDETKKLGEKNALDLIASAGNWLNDKEG